MQTEARIKLENLHAVFASLSDLCTVVQHCILLIKGLPVLFAVWFWEISSGAQEKMSFIFLEAAAVYGMNGKGCTFMCHESK